MYLLIVIVFCQVTVHSTVLLTPNRTSPHYFHKKYKMEATQVVKNTNIERMVEGVQLRQAQVFLKELSL